MKRRALLLVFMMASPADARADAQPPDVDGCIAAFDDGQRASSKSLLLVARERLIVCSQPTCPAVLRADCATVLREVEGRIPSVVFAVDDGRGADVANVSVYDGDTLLRERIDGTAQRVDPGERRFRFERAGAAAVTVEVVVREGERNRVVRASVPAGPKPVRAYGFVDEPRSVAGYVVPGALAALGVIGLGTSAVARVGFDQRVDELRSGCAPECSQSLRADLSDRLVTANVSLVAGLTSLLAAAASWWLLAPGRTFREDHIPLAERAHRRAAATGARGSLGE